MNNYLKWICTLIYAHEIGRIADEPYGAALTEPKLCAESPRSITG